MSCRACGVLSAGGQFCVACGQPLPSLLASTATAVTTREHERPTRSPWLAFQEIRLLACPRCGAPNSAARWRCARCGHTFDDASADDPSAEVTPPGEEVAAVQPESAPWLALITGVVGVAAVAVAIAMLASRGVGPFDARGEAMTVSQAVPAPIAERTASTWAPGAAPDLLADRDPSTAWHSEGAGAGEWIELRFDAAVQIDHLLVWNGDQRDAETFAAADRLRSVTITFPDKGKAYTAEFPDSDANFRVDMPDPPVSEHIRIEINSVYGSNGRAALSEVAALVSGGTAPDG